MTLEAYEEELKQRLKEFKEFKEWWLDNHSRNKNEFPLNLNRIDWDEYFINFIQR